MAVDLAGYNSLKSRPSTRTTRSQRGRERCEVHRPSEFLKEDPVAAITFGGVDLRTGSVGRGRRAV
jgi:hypothetical protein